MFVLFVVFAFEYCIVGIVIFVDWCGVKFCFWCDFGVACCNNI